MKFRSLIATVFVVASVLMAGCAGGEPAKTSAPAAGKKVSMMNVQYQPDAVSVKVGESVIWENSESVPHTVTFNDASMSGKSSSSMSKGQKHTVKFDAAGTFGYHCAIPGHATKQADGTWTGMVGNVTVTA